MSCYLTQSRSEFEKNNLKSINLIEIANFDSSDFKQGSIHGNKETLLRQNNAYEKNKVSNSINKDLTQIQND